MSFHLLNYNMSYILLGSAPLPSVVFSHIGCPYQTDYCIICRVFFVEISPRDARPMGSTVLISEAQVTSSDVEGPVKPGFAALHSNVPWCADVSNFNSYLQVLIDYFNILLRAKAVDGYNARLEIAQAEINFNLHLREFQIDLMVGRRVSGLVTQGEPGRNPAQVTSFMLHYGITQHTFLPYMATGRAKVGNVHIALQSYSVGGLNHVLLKLL